METKELIQALRLDAERAHANEWETPIMLGDHLDAAADALAALLAEVKRQAAEIAAVTAERDAAVEDINLLEDCSVCKHHDLDSCDLAGTKCHFEWRGPQVEKGSDNGN